MISSVMSLVPRSCKAVIITILLPSKIEKINRRYDVYLDCCASTAEPYRLMPWVIVFILLPGVSFAYRY